MTRRRHIYKRIILSVCLAWGIVCGPVSGEEAKKDVPASHRQALLIFADPTAMPPDKEEQTAVALRTMLLSAGFSGEHIREMRSNSPEERRPVLDNIRRELDQILRATVEESTGAHASERELFLFVQMRGISDVEQRRQYFCPLDRLDLPADKRFEDIADTLLPAGEFTDVLARSRIERRLLVLNITAPLATRSGLAHATLRGIRSSNLLDRIAASSASPASSGKAGEPLPERPGSALAQLVVNGRFDFDPEHADSLTAIMRNAFEGTADRDLDGNRDGSVSLREWIDYVAYYGNLAKSGSVVSLVKGFDYPLATALPPAKSYPGPRPEELFGKIGTELRALATEGKAGERMAEDTLDAYRRGIDTARRNKNETALRTLLRQRGEYHFARREFAPALTDFLESDGAMPIAVQNRVSLRSVSLSPRNVLRVAAVEDGHFVIEAVDGNQSHQGRLPLETPCRLVLP